MKNYQLLLIKLLYYETDNGLYFQKSTHYFLIDNLCDYEHDMLSLQQLSSNNQVN